MGGRYVRRRVCMVRRISGVEVIVAMQTALLVMIMLELCKWVFLLLELQRSQMY